MVATALSAAWDTGRSACRAARNESGADLRAGQGPAPGFHDGRRQRERSVVHPRDDLLRRAWPRRPVAAGQGPCGPLGDLHRHAARRSQVAGGGGLYRHKQGRAWLAAERRSTQELEAIESANTLLVEMGSSVLRWNVAFHDALARAAHNRHLERAMVEVRGELFLPVDAFLRQHRVEELAVAASV